MYLNGRKPAFGCGLSARWRQRGWLSSVPASCDRMRLTEFRRKSGRRPQTQSGMGNEKYLFTIDGVVAIVQFCRVIAGDRAGQIGIAESYAFCLLPGEATRAISDVETAFRGTVNEMSSGAELGRQIGILLHLLQRGRGAVVAESANHAVDGGILSKLLHPGSEHNQLRSIGQRHAGAVDRLIPQPGAVEFFRIEVDHGLAYGPIEQLHVDLNAELRGQAETFQVIPHK